MDERSRPTVPVSVELFWLYASLKALNIVARHWRNIAQRTSSSTHFVMFTEPVSANSLDSALMDSTSTDLRRSLSVSRKVLRAEEEVIVSLSRQHCKTTHRRASGPARRASSSSCRSDSTF